MSSTTEIPYPPSHRGRAPASTAIGSLLGALVILAGSGGLGLAAGLAWAGVAPRALYVVVGRGSADVVNPETTAFIAADAWYCLIGVIGGVVIGLAGYLFAVRRYGPLPMAAILAGGALAGSAARWIGVRQGVGHFDHQLLTTHQGTLLHAPLALAGDSSAAFWPAVAAFPAVAFWPLAAGAVAGGIVLVLTLRERKAAQSVPPSRGPAEFPFSTGR